MPYDDHLAERVRRLLGEQRGVSEKSMFGGRAFFVRGNLCVCVERDELLVRVGPEAYVDALRRPHAREMDVTGRPMKGFVLVGSAGVRAPAALRAWVARGVRYAKALPAKRSAAPG
jgi:TfoX/Sxy family transcriptional regulator of competence genes